MDESRFRKIEKVIDIPQFSDSLQIVKYETYEKNNRRVSSG
jgi:hypothetical protein